MIRCPGLYRNKKNRIIYEVKDILEDSTNGREGRRVVVYGYYSGAQKFVRDVEEFKVKFEEVR